MMNTAKMDQSDYAKLTDSLAAETRLMRVQLAGMGVKIEAPSLSGGVLDDLATLTQHRLDLQAKLGSASVAVPATPTAPAASVSATPAPQAQAQSASAKQRPAWVLSIERSRALTATERVLEANGVETLAQLRAKKAQAKPNPLD